MKNGFKHLRTKKGMTYVEILVALSILALIVVVFTPMLMLSYTRLYNAGEINVNTYQVKSNIEESLAVRGEDHASNMNFRFRELNQSVDLMMKRVVGTIEGLETVYYNSLKTSVIFISESTVPDNKSTYEIEFQLANFHGISNENFVKTSSPSETQVGYLLESPLSDLPITTSQYSASFDSETNQMTITVKDVDVTYSPIKISVYHIDSDGTKKTATNYLTITPANMIFAGGADANVGYYTSEGYTDETNSISIEARIMTGGSLTGGTQFNKVRWISGGIDECASNGYYAMCGNNGIIRRLWTITDDDAPNIPDAASIGYARIDGSGGEDYFRNIWNGDFTEIYTYGYESKAVKGKNIGTGSRYFGFNLKAMTYSHFSGFAADWGKGYRQYNSVQISHNVASEADFAPVTKEGRYFYTASNEKTYTGTPITLRKNWGVNWEDQDAISIYNDPSGGKKYDKDIWANYITSTNASAWNGYDQPVVFFASTGGSRNSDSGGRATISDTNQIDRVYLMTNNNTGSCRRWRRWSWFVDYYRWDIYKTGGEVDYSVHNSNSSEVNDSHSCAQCDIGARFTETMGAQYAYSNTLTTAQNQQRVIDFILDYMGSAVMTSPPSTSVFVGNPTSPESDSEIPFIRLKTYTNAHTNNTSNNIAALTRDSYNSDEKNAISVQSTTNASLNSVSVTLTDFCFISHPQTYASAPLSGSYLTYTGYTPASAVVYTPIATGGAHGNTTKGSLRNYIVQGQGGSSYAISQIPDSTNHVQNISAVPSNATTRTDSNTAFTIGYSSNRTLLYSSIPSLTFPSTMASDNTLHFPEEFNTYLGFAQDGDATLAVGYVVTGRAEAEFSTIENCRDSSHAYGSNPIDLNATNFFYDTSFFGNVNEDLATLDNNGNITYKRGYYLQAANPNNTSQASSYVYEYCTCAMACTGIKLNTTNTNQPITNSATIALHISGQSSFRTLYTAPLNTDSRFTCAAVLSQGGDDYQAYIGDNLGNVWWIEFNKNSTYVVPVLILAPSTTGLSEVREIYVTSRYIIAIGETLLSGNTTKALIYDSEADSIQSSSLVTSGKYSLHDIICHNDMFYAVGTYTSGGTLYGVVLYAENPLDTWTVVKKDSANNNFRPLYSVASKF